MKAVRDEDSKHESNPWQAEPFRAFFASRLDRALSLTHWTEARLQAPPALSNDLAQILKRASSPDVSVHPDKAKHTKSSRKSPRSRTNNHR
jgi:hypothetical protein